MPTITIEVTDFELKYVERAKRVYSRTEQPFADDWDWNLFLVSLAEDILELGPKRVERAYNAGKSNPESSR